MVKKLLTGLFVIMLFSMAGFTQSSGTLMGKLIDKETGEPIPFGNIVVETSGRQVGGTTSNFEGEYTIRPIPAGRYDVKATYVGYKPILVQNVVISPDKITFLDIEMESTAVTLTTFEVIDYKVPLIEKDGGSSGGSLTKEEIEKMPGRDASSVAVTVGGVFSQDGEVGSIRGQRTEGTVYYIDGVRVRGSQSLPKGALEQVTVITGGLPAQYGDATGGIIQITTRGASRNFGGGIELVTSQFLDPYGFNLLGFNVQGPLIKGRDSTQNTALLGFFISGEIETSEDSRPFASDIGVWKAKDDVLLSLEESPLRPTGLGFGAYQNGSYIRLADLEKVKTKINDRDISVNLAGKIDVRTTANTNLAFGGSLNYSNGLAYIHDYSLFNYDNNPQVINNTWRVYGRFAQRFPTDTASNSPIKNVFYQIQVDFSKYTEKVQDPEHQDNLFHYGYIGKFTTTKVRSYELTDLSSLGLYNVYVHNGFRDLLYWFEPNYEINPVLATYTQRYYNLYDVESGMYSNSVLVQNGGGLLNGEQPEYILGLWASPGSVYNSYSMADLTQFGVNANASADIGRHSFQFGFQYEQRIDRSYGTAPVGLWYRMRQLTNKHIEQIDTANPILVFDEWGIFQDTVWYNRIYDEASQSFFDYNLRQALIDLGLPAGNLDWLDVDSYDPSLLTIDWFSADELLNEGTSPYVSYYGYDHTGKKLTTKPSFDDFFNKTDEFGNFTREIPAFEPIYMAGFIQDKFAFRDLIFNIGVRVDRFDANQKVLKDAYLLYEAKTVADVNEFGDHPSNMGNEYVVYVDDIRFPTTITGYRDGDTWFNSQGIEVTDPTLLRGPGGISPYLVDPSLTKPTSAAFKDYDPQITVMPRISFSFPISDVALFFAHYDVLSKRPTSGLRLDPTDYYFIQAQGQNLLSNPNLKPELTVDYELGFQQMLNLKSAIKFSAYYREIRSLVQAYRFTEAYPVSYISYNNIDFGTVKGMTISYDLRRSSNVWIKTSYTLQFADGTGSSATSAVSLVRSGQPNLRIINPLDFDRRHAFTLVVDYRYGSGKNYNGPTIKRKMKDGSGKVKNIPFLQNTGANITFVGGSGVPYSRSSSIVATQLGGGSYVLQGSLNGSRLPWQFTMNARVDRDIEIKYGSNKKKLMYANVYFEILNVLDAMNIMGVYRATGNADDDGYLAAAEYQAGINAQLDPLAFREQYALKVNSPYNYSLPRRIRFGVAFNF
jgi:hypothetical protein